MKNEKNVIKQQVVSLLSGFFHHAYYVSSYYLYFVSLSHILIMLGTDYIYISRKTNYMKKIRLFH